MSDLNCWEVFILNNFYDGRYYNYSARRYPVLASSESEARQVVLDNGDYILKDFQSRRTHQGKRTLSIKYALDITESQIGRICESSVHTKRTTVSSNGTAILSPRGIVNVILKDGKVVKVLENEI